MPTDPGTLVAASSHRPNFQNTSLQTGVTVGGNRPASAQSIQGVRLGQVQALADDQVIPAQQSLESVADV